MSLFSSPLAAALAGTGLACFAIGATRRPDPGLKLTGLAVLAFALTPVPAHADQFVEAGLTRSLTEAESYTREARRAEEMASRLETQAGWYEANSAAGTLNLSQAYREWGMAEIESNRDYYGPVRFDDIDFQMSSRGQQLQSRFVEGYADQLQEDIEGDLSLPTFSPVHRPGIGNAGQVRARGAVGSASGPAMPEAPDRSGIADEVDRARRQGQERIGTVRGYVDRRTQGATGASEEAADGVKEW